MKKLLFLLGFLTIQTSFGQVTITENEINIKNNKIAPENSISNFRTDTIEEKPEYPGGIEKFYEFIGLNYKLPYTKTGGKVIVSFVIEIDGSLSDIKVIRDIGKESADEAIRVLKSSPKWKPGKHKGKQVRCVYTLPISIQPSK